MDSRFARMTVNGLDGRNKSSGVSEVELPSIRTIFNFLRSDAHVEPGTRVIRLSSSRKRGSIFSKLWKSWIPALAGMTVVGAIKFQVLCHLIISKKTASDLCEVSRRLPCELASQASISRFFVRILRILSIASERTSRSFRLSSYQR
jgi:hypothetical protein